MIQIKSVESFTVSVWHMCCGTWKPDPEAEVSMLKPPWWVSLAAVLDQALRSAQFDTKSG